MKRLLACRGFAQALQGFTGTGDRGDIHLPAPSELHHKVTICRVVVNG